MTGRVVTNRLAPTSATPTLAAVSPEHGAELEPYVEPAIVSIPNLVIASVGDWATVAGDGVMTRDDLASAVAASHDPGFRAAPKGKPGHYDPRFDGGPGIGRLVNLRLSDDGMDLIADVVGLFAWQRTLLLTAYPSRSVEAVRGVQSTATWRTYGFVITAIAWLGVEWPAVATLDDLEAWVTDEGPEAAQELVAASIRRGRDDDEQEDEVAGRNSGPVRAAANIDQVRRDFIDWADEQSRYSWWIRELWLDPNYIIVDDDQGNLFRVPFTVTDNAVTFGDAVPVEVSYIDATPSQGEAVAASRPSFAQVYANRSDSRPANNTTQEGDHMDTQSIIDLLDLPADTTDEQAQQALTKARAAAAANADGEGDGDEGDGDGSDADGDGDEGGTTTTTETPDTKVTVNASSAIAVPDGLELPAGTRLVSDAQFAAMEATVQRLAAREAEDVKASRDRLVNDAVKAGRIAPAERKRWRDDLDAAPEVTGRILASLAPTIPVEERGTSASADELGNDDSHPFGDAASQRPAVAFRKG